MITAPVFWCTGLSGAGKTTVTTAVKSLLEADGYRVVILDGDDVRAKLHFELGFSEKDIKLNNRLIADLCLDHRKNCEAILVPIISPYEESRRAARKILGPQFHEIWFDAPLSCVMARDTKGLYAKASAGEIENMIGLSPSNPYEPPCSPDFTVPTSRESLDTCVRVFHQYARSALSAK